MSTLAARSSQHPRLWREQPEFVPVDRLSLFPNTGVGDRGLWLELRAAVPANSVRVAGEPELVLHCCRLETRTSRSTVRTTDSRRHTRPFECRQLPRAPVQDSCTPVCPALARLRSRTQ